MGSDEWRIFLCLTLTSITAKDMKKDKKKKVIALLKPIKIAKFKLKFELQKDAYK